jgi:hypothetical protein
MGHALTPAIGDNDVKRSQTNEPELNKELSHVHD